MNIYRSHLAQVFFVFSTIVFSVINILLLLEKFEHLNIAIVKDMDVANNIPLNLLISKEDLIPTTPTNSPSSWITKDIVMNTHNSSSSWIFEEETDIAYFVSLNALDPGKVFPLRRATNSINSRLNENLAIKKNQCSTILPF